MQSILSSTIPSSRGALRVSTSRRQNEQFFPRTIVKLDRHELATRVDSVTRMDSVHIAWHGCGKLGLQALRQAALQDAFDFRISNVAASRSACLEKINVVSYVVSCLALTV